MLSRTPARVTRSTVRNRNLSDASNLPNEDLTFRSPASSPESIVIQPLHTIVNSDNPVVFPSISGNQMASEATQQNIVSNAQSSNRREELGSPTLSTFLMDEHGVYNVEMPVTDNLREYSNNTNVMQTQVTSVSNLMARTNFINLPISDHSINQVNSINNPINNCLSNTNCVPVATNFEPVPNRAVNNNLKTFSSHHEIGNNANTYCGINTNVNFMNLSRPICHSNYPQKPVMTTSHLHNLPQYQTFTDRYNQNLDSSKNIFYNQGNHFGQNRVINTNQNQLNSNNFPVNYNYQCPIKINLPTFSGENDEDPIEYLEKLENYFRCQNIPETYQLIIVEQSLSNKALRWFGGFRMFFNNFTEFKNNFLSEYWGFNKQQKIRMQLYSDTYNNYQRKQSMADYFITIYKKCKQLNPPLHEFEFMSLIRRHFPVHVQRVLLTATIGSFVEIYNLLKELDELESNRPFNTYRPNTNNSFNARDSRDNGEQITKPDPVKSAQTSLDYKNKTFNFANTTTHRQPNSQFVNNQGAIPKSRINSLEINYDLPSQYPEANEIHSDVNSKNE